MSPILLPWFIYRKYFALESKREVNSSSVYQQFWECKCLLCASKITVSGRRAERLKNHLKADHPRSLAKLEHRFPKMFTFRRRSRAEQEGGPGMRHGLELLALAGEMKRGEVTRFHVRSVLPWSILRPFFTLDPRDVDPATGSGYTPYNVRCLLCGGGKYLRAHSSSWTNLKKHLEYVHPYAAENLFGATTIVNAAPGKSRRRRKPRTKKSSTETVSSDGESNMSVEQPTERGTTSADQSTKRSEKSSSSSSTETAGSDSDDSDSSSSGSSTSRTSSARSTPTGSSSSSHSPSVKSMDCPTDCKEEAMNRIFGRRKKDPTTLSRAAGGFSTSSSTVPPAGPSRQLASSLSNISLLRYPAYPLPRANPSITFHWRPSPLSPGPAGHQVQQFPSPSAPPSRPVPQVRPQLFRREANTWKLY